MVRKRSGKLSKVAHRAALSPKQVVEMDSMLRRVGKRSNRPIAIFLGAGAASSFGYPLTRDLMLRIFEGLTRNKILSKSITLSGVVTKEARAELLTFLSELLPGERMSRETVPMVTGVLSLMDFSLATGQALLPGRTLEETRRARHLLERALLEVIPDYDWFDSEEEARFDQFCSCLRHLRRHRPPGGLSLITTNYDMVSDVAAMEAASVHGDDVEWSVDDLARKVDFGFRWIRPTPGKQVSFSRPERPKIALYKLHGSTNWLRCPLCENLYINPAGPIAWIAMTKDKEGDNECHCSATRLEAQIVSPSFVRDMRAPNLVAIWKNALDALREADDWLIIGYSFPDEDVGIRALFTRAFGATTRQPRISVVQLNEDARVNYESFFPQGSVEYVTGGMELLLERWRPAVRKHAASARRSKSGSKRSRAR
jgi:NAD-dependent SIR2 family protein deacetylase